MNISKILRDIQTSAVLETGSAEEFELFLEGKTKIEGVKMTSHTTMRFGTSQTIQISSICCAKP